MSNNVTVLEGCENPLRGVVRVPGDKSISHRAVLFSAMAEGVSRIEGVLNSADVQSSLAAVRALGAETTVEEQPDGSLAGTVRGWGARGPQTPAAPIDCGNSGTTVRLLMGVLAPWQARAELTGDASLCRRPMRRITEPLARMGAHFDPANKETLPFAVAGGAGLRGITYDMPVASAQLKTALLLAGIFAQGETEVHEPASSRNCTETMLPAYGVEVESGAGWARVRGGQALRAASVAVPGDPSSAAFPVCAALLCVESDVRVAHVDLSPARIGFVRVLQRMGAQIELQPEADASLYGDIAARYTPRLQGCVVEPEEIASLVDEVPVLSLVAAFAEGETVFRGAGELRVKETDRFQAIIDGLAQLGVRAWADGDDLHIQGNPALSLPQNLEFDSLGDHRLAMTWALVALACGQSVRIRDFEAVRVSYPRFLDDMLRLTK